MTAKLISHAWRDLEHRPAALSDDPLYTDEFLSFVDTQLAGRLQTRISAVPGGRAAAVGHEYFDRIPLTFHLQAYLTAAGVDAGTGGRWLVLGTPVRFRTGLLGEPQALARLLEDVLSGAKDEGFDGVSVPWVEYASEEVREVLANAGFHSSFYDADWYLDTAGFESAQELFASLPRVPRRNFRNDRKRFEAAGIEVRKYTSADDDDIIAMHREFMTDYGHRAPEFADSAFAEFAALDGGNLEVAVDPVGSVLGFVLVLSGTANVHVLRWGRRESGLDARIYANLGYHRPLEIATELGARRVWFGKNAHEFKRLRGLTPEPAAVYAKALDPAADTRLRQAMGEADDFYRARYRKLTGQC
ncbi:hypothetical protein SMCF_7395 [Streptomyces coelicoflavus ZG0656]|nr:hypothetical protein SMCF_7395 [Streptomyces coelicoflavus ZG0656]MZE49254.1 hypothetical protein [Streptomyces sp. SID5477]